VVSYYPPSRGVSSRQLYTCYRVDSTQTTNTHLMPTSTWRQYAHCSELRELNAVEEGLPELPREKMCVALTVPPKPYPDLWTSVDRSIYTCRCWKPAGPGDSGKESAHCCLAVHCLELSRRALGCWLQGRGTGHRARCPAVGPNPSRTHPTAAYFQHRKEEDKTVSKHTVNTHIKYEF